jgi:CheY-like chemotaxis protein
MRWKKTIGTFLDFPCISKALQALDEGKCADVAVLDVNLNGERVYPLLDRLMLEDMPIVLMTGYESNTIPSTYTRLPCLRKPAPMQQLIDCVNKLLAT